MNIFTNNHLFNSLHCNKKNNFSQSTFICFISSTKLIFTIHFREEDLNEIETANDVILESADGSTSHVALNSEQNIGKNRYDLDRGRENILNTPPPPAFSEKDKSYLSHPIIERSL